MRLSRPPLLSYTSRLAADADYAALISTPVSELSHAQISHIDIGSWMGEQWAGERVPSFRAALQELREARARSDGAHIFAELKGPEDAPVGARNCIHVAYMCTLSIP